MEVKTEANSGAKRVQDTNAIYDSIPFVEPLPSFRAFFCAIKHEYDFEIYKIWNEYRDQIGQYVISKEISEDGTHAETNGEHFHFCAQMSNETYHRISKRLFKDRFKLRGQAKDGLPKQYGKVSEIRDEARMIAYCLKDGDYKTNIPADKIAEYKKISFRKIKPNVKKGTTFTEKIRDQLQERYPDREWYPDECCDGSDANIVLDCILDNLGKNAKVFDRNTLHKLYNGVMNSLKMTPRAKDKYWKRWKAQIITGDNEGTACFQNW